MLRFVHDAIVDELCAVVQRACHNGSVAAGFMRTLTLPLFILCPGCPPDSHLVLPHRCHARRFSLRSSSFFTVVSTVYVSIICADEHPGHPDGQPDCLVRVDAPVGLQEACWCFCQRRGLPTGKFRKVSTQCGTNVMSVVVAQHHLGEAD